MVLKLCYFIIIFSLVSCVDSARTRSIDNTDYSTNTDNDESSSTTSGGTVYATGVSPEVELTHFIDPYDGSYTRKLTLPRNFGQGAQTELYIAGINIGTLASKNVKVRFSFGKDRTPVVLSAITGRGPGATPNTVVDVLIIDMEQQPLHAVQLFYSLFDYNQYDFDTSATGAETQVATDNRDTGLYCRGLLLDDDPTFTGSGCNASSPGGQGACLYGYANLKDKGLARDFGASYVFTIPQQMQIATQTATPYYSHSHSEMLARCLPDVPAGTGVIGNQYQYNTTTSFVFNGPPIGIDGINYKYEGPFRTVNETLWAMNPTTFPETSFFGPYGLFQTNGTLATASSSISAKLDAGVRSNLFPRFIRKTLAPNVEHIATATTSIGANEAKGIQSLISGQNETNWLDGCNARIGSRNMTTGEDIGSCNVTAKIEILHHDFQLARDILVLESKNLKLQLVKPAVISSSGENVLSNSFSACSSNNECGGEECCFNNRCWSKTIVSQCLDETLNTGNLPSGAACSNDLQCASLCCDQTLGVCNVHQNISEASPVFCGKAPGQTCVAKSWCAKQIVPECYVVSTGPGPTDCMYQCYNVERFGDCVENTCTAPVPRPSDPWNPLDPNRCESARDPAQTPPPF